MKKSKLNEVIRWVGLIPVVFIAPILGCIILLIFMLIGDFFSGELWLYLRYPDTFIANHYFTSFIVFVLFGHLFIITGTSIAPRGKVIVAFLLFGVITLSLGFILIATLLFTKFSDSWRLTTNLIVCIISSGITAFNVVNNLHQKRIY